MEPAVVTLALEVVFIALAIGWRTLQQRRSTGSSGFVAMRERGAAARVAALLMVASLVGLAAGPVVRLGDDASWTAPAAIGVLAMLGGLGLTLLAQQHMGASWRIGVDPDERTDLVTGGVFARVRNPIFSAMVLFAVGVALTSGDVLSALGAAALAIGVALQVLAVEEPHLRRTHGRAYERYMDSSGRFLPRLLRPATTRDGTA